MDLVNDLCACPSTLNSSDDGEFQCHSLARLATVIGTMLRYATDVPEVLESREEVYRLESPLRMSQLRGIDEMERISIPINRQEYP